MTGARFTASTRRRANRRQFADATAFDGFCDIMSVDASDRDNLQTAA